MGQVYPFLVGTGDVPGADSSTLYHSMLPVKPRKAGVLVDRDITNIDSSRNFFDYRLEELAVPVLVIHAKDDPMAKFATLGPGLDRIDAQTVFFETGGHLICGHDEEVAEAIIGFI